MNISFNEAYLPQLHHSLICEALKAFRDTEEAHAQGHYDITTDSSLWFACDGRSRRGSFGIGGAPGGMLNLARTSDIPNTFEVLPDWCIYAKPPNYLPYARVRDLKERLWPMRPEGAILNLRADGDVTYATFEIRVADEQKAVDIRLERKMLPADDEELYKLYIKPALIVLTDGNLETPFGTQLAMSVDNFSAKVSENTGRDRKNASKVKEFIHSAENLGVGALG